MKWREILISQVQQGEPVSAVAIADWLRAGRSGDPVGARFSVPVQTGPGVHPATCTVGTGSFPGVKRGRGVTLTPHPLLVPWSRKSRDKHLLPLWVVRPVQSLSACIRCTLPYFTKSSKQKPPLVANSSSVDQEIPRPLQFVCDLLRPKSSHY
jgi:hypothetical protein